MAIDIYLQSADGKKHGQVFDLNNSLSRLWPIGDSSFPLLQYLDPYGDAIFNRSQMPEIRKELELLHQRSATEEQRTVLVQILGLVKKAEKEPHWFLRFVGD